MPCDAIYQISCKLGQTTDLELLKKAMLELGYTDVVIYGDGERAIMTFMDKYYKRGTINRAGEVSHNKTMAFDVSSVLQAYGMQVVYNNAEQMGWQVETTDQPNRLRLRR